MHQYPYPLRYTCSFVGLSFPLLHTENCQIQHIYMSTQIAVSRHVTANCIILCHLHWFWRWRERTRKEKTKGWLCIGWTWGINNWRWTRGDSVRGVTIQLFVRIGVETVDVFRTCQLVSMCGACLNEDWFRSLYWFAGDVIESCKWKRLNNRCWSQGFV